MREPETLVRARELLGAPYRHLGRDRRGIDCVGTIWHALNVREDEHELYRQAMEVTGGYYRDPEWLKQNPEAAIKCAGFLLAALTKHLLKVKLSHARPGDILLMSFKSRDRKTVDHAGILGDGVLIHATIQRGVIEQQIDARIYRRIIHVFRKPAA